MNLRLLLSGLLIVFLFSGCAGILPKGKKAASSGLLEPQSALKFADAPVPMGFNLMPEESYSFESSGLRVGLLKYTGKANIEQVVNFYKEQMPLYNWRLLNVIEYNERLMNFDREEETCTVTLLPKGKNVIVTIAVGPKSKTGKSREKPVK